MKLVFLKNFNNYFNRIIKYHDRLENYIKDHEFFITEKVNFNVNDGVTTTQIVRTPDEVDFVPDYALLVEPIGNGHLILSRWFIMEWKKVSGKQYQASFRNDVVANYIEHLYEAPVFVEKGYIDNVDNPLIFNNEGMTYNEIKVGEKMLRDRTRMGWLVGYMVQEFPNGETEKKFISKSAGDVSGTPVDISTLNPNIHINFDNAQVPTDGIVKDRYFSVHTSNKRGTYFDDETYKIDFGSSTLQTRVSHSYETKMVALFHYGYTDESREMFASELLRWAKSKREAIFNTLFIPYFGSTQVNDKDITDLDGIFVKNSSNDVYKLSVKRINNGSLIKNIPVDNPDGTPNVNNEYIVKFRELIASIPYLIDRYDPVLSRGTGQIMNNRNYIEATEEVNRYVVTATPITAVTVDLNTTVKNSRNHLLDAPYDMFCIPYMNDDSRHIKIKGDQTFKTSNVKSLAMAKGMVTQAGGSGTGNTYIYDIQYLPYCPIKEIRDKIVGFASNEMILDLNKINATIDIDYSLIKEGQDNVSIMFWAKSRTGTFDIDFRYPENSAYLKDPMTLKVMNETDKIRICSPNYAGVFEMSPAKNRGIDFINVDYTYKPFDPYIHLNPNFKGLYGDDYNDSRGLIVRGDFSLETLSDAMVNYTLRNKNYQAMFDREIENLDVNNSIKLTTDITSAVFGTIGAGLAGGIGGAMSGVPGAGIIGGLATGIGSAIGAGADIALGQQAYRENRDFKTDMFGYQLGNIKALPRSLTKTTAFTANHKIFPFVEFYDCTREEKEALINKILYNGMTIMKVDKVGNYISSGNEKHFFKGEIIRLDSLVEDSHVANEIYNEIKKGVFF